MDKKTLISGGIVAVMAILGGNEVQNTLERNALVAEFKQPVMEEVQKRAVGEEIKSLRKPNSETFKGPENANGQPTFQARVYSGQKYWNDADADTLRPLDLTVREISALAKLNPLRTHDKYVDAGPYTAQWKDEKPNDFRMDAGDVYVKYTALFDVKAAPVTVVVTATGMKETITLADEKSPHELRWLVNTDGSLVPGAGNEFRIRAHDGTYPMEISPPVATDAAGKPVMAVASVSGDTLTFRVTVLPGQEYPVTVDPTTTTAAIGVAAVSLQGYGADYITGRNLTTSNVAIQHNYFGYQVAGKVTCREFMNFPLSMSMSSCDACTLYVDGYDDTTVDFGVHIYGARKSRSTYTTEDYSNFSNWAASGAYDSSKVLNNTWHTSSFSLNWNKLIFNSTGLDSMKVAANDTLWIILLSNTDVAASEPAGNAVIGFTATGGSAPYLSFTYTGIYQPVPTSFTLSSPAISSLYASWVNHHSTNIDSLRIFTGAGVWQKTLSKTDQNTTITGLTPNTSYTFKARVDSGGIFNYSNADTLYTLAAAPSSFALAGTDSTIFTPSWTENSNPAATTYAIRDSTLQKWVGGDGIADSSAAGWLTHAQWLTKNINLVTNNVIHTVGIVAKNGDGVQTTYDWITATTGNYYVRTITPLRWYNYAGLSGSEASARAQTLSDSIIAAGSNELGQSLVDTLYSVFRAGGEWVLPRITEVLTDSLLMTGIGDLSDTDFNIRAAKGTWNANTPTKEWYYTFSGWTAGAGAYTITDLIKASFSTADYATTMRIAMSDSGAALITRTSADTLRMVILSSRDVAATAPSGDEYIGASTASLKLFYTLFDAVPSNVVVTSIAGATDSILVTWTDNSLTETGYALVNAYTGTRLGGDDSTAADTSVKRMGGRTPNTKYNIAIKVLGGKIAGDVSTAQDSCYTRAAVLIKPIVRMDTDSTRKVIIDTTGSGNPGYTRYAISDSITGKFVDWISGSLDTLHGTWTSSTAEYRTFANWNISGDTTTVKYSVGKTSAFRIYSKSSQ